MWLLTASTLPHSSRRSLEKLTPQLTYSKLTANKTWTSGKRKLGLQKRRGMSYFLLLLFFSSALQTRWWWRREKGRHDWWMQAGRGENASPVGFVASGGLKGERSPPHTTTTTPPPRLRLLPLLFSPSAQWQQEPSGAGRCGGKLPPGARRISLRACGKNNNNNNNNNNGST